MGRPTAEMIKIANRFSAKMEKRNRPTKRKQRKNKPGNGGDCLVKVGRDSEEWKRILVILEETPAGYMGLHNAGGHAESRRKQMLGSIEDGDPISNKIMRNFPVGIQQEIKAIQRGEWKPGMHLEKVLNT